MTTQFKAVVECESTDKSYELSVTRITNGKAILVLEDHEPHNFDLSDFAKALLGVKVQCYSPEKAWELIRACFALKDGYSYSLTRTIDAVIIFRFLINKKLNDFEFYHEYQIKLEPLTPFDILRQKISKIEKVLPAHETSINTQRNLISKMSSSVDLIEHDLSTTKKQIQDHTDVMEANVSKIRFLEQELSKTAHNTKELSSLALTQCEDLLTAKEQVQDLSDKLAESNRKNEYLEQSALTAAQHLKEFCSLTLSQREILTEYVHKTNAMQAVIIDLSKKVDDLSANQTAMQSTQWILVKDNY
jgi:hypothetical protein